jgi:hypothetical protein
VKTLFIEPGSLWENSYVESLHGKLRDECLQGEVFEALLEAQVLIERWRHEYNTLRPHSALGYRPPAPEEGIVIPGLRKTALALGSPPKVDHIPVDNCQRFTPVQAERYAMDCVNSAFRRTKTRNEIPGFQQWV